MKKDKEAQGIRIMCFVLFLAFTLCWFFMQRELIVYTIHTLSNTKGSMDSFSFVYISVIVFFLLLSAVPVSRIVFKFRYGHYACNYAVSAFILGCLTGFDGTRFFSQTLISWIIGVSLLILILIIPTIVSFLNNSTSYKGLRTVASNLMIFSILFCITAVMGNTDENLHRRLRIENLVSRGDYVNALEVGMNEEETDPSITLLRVKAMLGLDAANPGSGVGEHLFSYPIADAESLIDSLCMLESDSLYDGCTIRIALAMLVMDIHRADSLIAPLIHERNIPTYYMQLLVLSENKDVASFLPDEFETEQKKYESFNELLSQYRNESVQFQANSTYIHYHDTYYWYYTFCDR